MPMIQRTKMMQKNNWISHRIRLMANRVRCSECNADSSEAFFVIGESVKFKIPIGMLIDGRSLPRHISKEDYFPIFREQNKHGKMAINKLYSLVSAESLTRICVRCGKSRRTGIPNSFS